MRLIGLDIVEDFYARYRHMSWAWEVDVLVMELANREWTDPKELLHDYPTAETKPPAVVFSVAGGQVLVRCLILFAQGIILIKEFIWSEVQKGNEIVNAGGGRA